jgi:hypothetical protein
MSAFVCKANIDATLPNVRFWPKADIPTVTMNVRFLSEAITGAIARSQINPCNELAADPLGCAGL